MTCGSPIGQCRIEHDFWSLYNKCFTKYIVSWVKFCSLKPAQAFILLLVFFLYSCRLKSKSSDLAPGFSLSQNIWEIFSFQILRFCWILNVSLLGIQIGVSKHGISTALILWTQAISASKLSHLFISSFFLNIEINLANVLKPVKLHTVTFS